MENCLVPILILFVGFAIFGLIKRLQWLEQNKERLPNIYKLHVKLSKSGEPLYMTLEFLPDQIDIDNTSFINNINLKWASIMENEEDVKIINKYSYGGKNYKRMIVYRLTIAYTSQIGLDSRLNFRSTSIIDAKKYKEVAKRINHISGYTPQNLGGKKREL
ncbi:hypothetical protein JR338_11095 [Chloroflexota bacterium]|nr:hypothetical protein JR338_11095 [Chloroflexota bacterium]